MKEKTSDSRSHQEIQYLLPWRVNETLTVPERESVDAHLSDCSACRAELETLKALSSGLKTANEELRYPSDSRVEQVIARIQEFETREAQPTSFAQFRNWWFALPAFSKKAMTAQAVALILLTGMAGVLLRRAGNLEATAIQERQRADLNETLLARERERAAEYKALSASQENGGPGIRITVVFREDATEKEIRGLLLGIEGAAIVSGPSPGRFYVIGVTASPHADLQKLKNETIAQLRRRSDLVQLAEPLP